MNLSSTLVETVSIDYEDFNETYLTCGTCLCESLIITSRLVVPNVSMNEIQYG